MSKIISELVGKNCKIRTNDTAWPYAIVYGMLALAGGLVGKIFHKPAK